MRKEIWFGSIPAPDRAPVPIRLSGTVNWESAMADETFLDAGVAKRRNRTGISGVAVAT